MGTPVSSIVGKPGRPKGRPNRRQSWIRYKRLMRAGTALLAGMLGNPALITARGMEDGELRMELADAALRLAAYLDRQTRAECTAEDR